MKTCVEIEMDSETGEFTVTDCSKEEGVEYGMESGMESGGMHQMPDGEMMRDSMMDSGGMQEGMPRMGEMVSTLKEALMAAAEILSSGESTSMADKQAAFSSADERLTR